MDIFIKCLKSKLVTSLTQEILEINIQIYFLSPNRPKQRQYIFNIEENRTPNSTSSVELSVKHDSWRIISE